MSQGSREAAQTTPSGARLGGVRADFVANLGKHLAELQRHWATLEAEPASPRHRDEVRRRIHALAMRARVLGFVAMAGRLEQAESRLEQASTSGGMEIEDVAWFLDLFRDLPALAWNEVGTTVQEPAPQDNGTAATPPLYPLAVLVVGGPNLLDALALEQEMPGAPPPDWERTDVPNALQVARVFAPDVVLIDTDLPGARDVVKALARDTLTESVPVVTIGSWAKSEQASELVLDGVARALAKPVSPRKLRQALVQAAATPRSVHSAEALGTTTVEELANQLAGQIRAGLLDALRPESRQVRVDLGEGTEVLAALWGAVARVRETLTVKSRGAIRFASSGPAGAVPAAAVIESPERPARRNGPREPGRADLRLDGYRVLVADDDPAVTWFLSGFLRTKGATVHEARDGQQALELAFKVNPQLVVSDILMPKLDGFALCRTLKRDVLLRDVAVVLLSWKEDLLQRVRELGADADGYLRKEAATTAIERIVQEVLRPRQRIEQRLREGGEVRGRLDGLTALSLVRLVSEAMPDALVSIRDANYVYELQLRGGQARTVVRSGSHEPIVRAGAALESMLGITSGRFQVMAATEPVEDTLGGDPMIVIGPAIARARAAQHLLSGERLVGVERIMLRTEQLMLEALPLTSRSILQALASGRSPRDLMLRQQASPAIIEQLLADAAACGAVIAVFDEHGLEMLGVETQHQMQRLQRERAERAGSNEAASNDAALQPARESMLSLLDFGADEPEPPPQPEQQPAGATAPSSLVEAVIREVHDGDDRSSSAPPAAMLDARELRPRSSSRPDLLQVPSLPPDAIVPGNDSINPEPCPCAEPSVPAVLSFPPPPRIAGLATVSEDWQEAAKKPVATCQDHPGGDVRVDDEPPPPSRSHAQSEAAHVQESDELEPQLIKRFPWGPVITLTALAAIAVLGLVLAPKLGFQQSPAAKPGTTASIDAPKLPASPQTAPSASARTTAPAPERPAPSASSSGEAQPIIDYGLSLPTGSTVRPQHGLLELRTARADATVSVDGRAVGRGSLINVELEPGSHEVNVAWRGQTWSATVRVDATRRTRVDLEQQWR